jgi:hypothetical protein
MKSEQIKQIISNLNIEPATLKEFVRTFGSNATEQTLNEVHRQNKTNKIIVNCSELINNILSEHNETKNNLDELIKKNLADRSIYISETIAESSEVLTESNTKKGRNGKYDLIEESFNALTEEPKKALSKKTIGYKLSHNITDKRLNELIESIKNIENKVNNLDNKLNVLENFKIAFDRHNEEFKIFENDISKFAIKKDNSKFGFYCLLTLLSMLFYIAGSTSYFFFDAIVYPKLHAYLAGVSIPLLIVGIVIGILYKPIFIRIFRWNK